MSHIVHAVILLLVCGASRVLPQNLQNVNQGDDTQGSQDSSIYTSSLWPKSSNGKVRIPYVISSDFSEHGRASIVRAMQELTAMTCLLFQGRSTESEYIQFIPSSGCWAYVGKIKGPQSIGLNVEGCMAHGQIQHELLHTIGFIHEVNRSDRDNYVTLLYENIKPAQLSIFQKTNFNYNNMPYDYGSVMHWKTNAYSINGGPTFVPKFYTTEEIGQVNGASRLDISKVNVMYDCNLCRTLVSGFSGSISSSNYPFSYPNNANCLYLIRIPYDRIFLTFQSVDIQYSKNCASDYFRVYDGLNTSSPLLLGNTCGTTLPYPLISSGNVMLIEFVTDGFGIGKGFLASYTNVTCGGVYTSILGTVSSPNYPQLYPSNMKCLYSITAPTGFKVLLTITTFFLEPTSRCSDASDYLTIYDGSSTRAPILRKFCGYMPLIPVVISTSNNMMLQFISNDAFNYPGFTSIYSFVPSLL